MYPISERAEPGVQIADHSKSSFIFSLTENDKFDLRASNCAIIRHQKPKQIIFGENELVIGENANIDSSGASATNICYYNDKYKQY